MSQKSIYIEKIQIENFRSCKKVLFKPREDLSALIGPNGSGKTTTLKAFTLLKELHKPMRHFRTRPGGIEPTKINTTIFLDGRKISHKVSALIDTDENNKDIVLSARHTWNFTLDEKRISLTLPSFIVGEISAFNSAYPKHMPDPYREMKHFLSYSLKKKNLKEHQIQDCFQIIAKITSFYDGLSYYSASQFTNPAQCPVSIEIQEDSNRSRNRYLDLTRAKDTTQNHRQWILDMYTAYKEKNPNFKEFIQIVGSDGLKLIDEISFQEISVSNIEYTVKIGGKSHKQSKIKNLIIPEVRINKSILSPSQLSEGTFKTLGMLFYLMTGKGSVILLEEPEVCVHHGLLTSIVELLKTYSKDKQVIFSTHSDYILDALNANSVFRVFKDRDNGTNVQALKKSLSKEDVSALKNFLATEGTLGEYWRAGGIDV